MLKAHRAKSDGYIPSIHLQLDAANTARSSKDDKTMFPVSVYYKSLESIKEGTRLTSYGYFGFRT